MVHGCVVYTEYAEMAAVSCGTGHASAVSTSLRWIFKTRYKKAIHSCGITYVSSESARERTIALYKSDQQQQQLNSNFVLIWHLIISNFVLIWHLIISNFVLIWHLIISNFVLIWHLIISNSVLIWHLIISNFVLV